MTFHAIGLMSGTSLDGLDLCYASFVKNKLGFYAFEIINAETLPNSKNWEEKLRTSHQLNPSDLLALNTEYGFYLGTEVQHFINKNKITKIDVIASHGHTVFHQPERKFTLQIGDGRAIKLVNNIPTIYDFRSQDVLMGGNGAPLVPIGDKLLFSNYEACLNLGGFSNISLTHQGERIAFDICPVNIVLNEYASKLGKKFDENGALAKSGTVDKILLKQLNELDFYHQSSPKSLGQEWVTSHVTPLLEGKKPTEVLATFTEHIAVQIAETCNKYQLQNLLVTGGGAYNQYLIEQLKTKTNTEIILPGNKIINFKEALIFALMGVLKINNEVNVLASATGSSHDHSSGILA